MKNNFDISNKKVAIIGCKNWASSVIERFKEKTSVITIGEDKQCDFTVNVTKDDDWYKLKDKIEEEKIKFDGLVTIGKVSEIDGLITMPADKWIKIVSENLRIIYQSVDTLSDFINSNGSIVNILEIGSMEGLGGGSKYESFEKESRVLLRGFANSLAVKKVRINALRIGFVETEKQEGANKKLREIFKKTAEKNIPLKTVGSLDDITSTIIYLISDASKLITGEEIHIDGGAHIET